MTAKEETHNVDGVAEEGVNNNMEEILYFRELMPRHVRIGNDQMAVSCVQIHSRGTYAPWNNTTSMRVRDWL